MDSLEMRRRLLPLWSAVDQAMMLDYWADGPWESNNPNAQAAWERLTRPDNLEALEAWAVGVESFNDFARRATLRALEDCRARCRAGRE